MSSFTSTSSLSIFGFRSFTTTSDGNGVKTFEKGRKELSNGKKWILRLITPIVRQSESDEEKIAIPDDWSRGRFWRGV